MELKACIYDLDGVIADLAEYQYKSWKWVADELGMAMSLKQFMKIRTLEPKEILEKMLRQSYSRISEAEKQHFLNERKRLYLEQIDQLKPEDIKTGFTSFNDQLREQGVKIALSSMSKYTIRIIDKLDLVMAFDAIVDGGMLKPGQPGIQRFQMVCDKLELEPGECLVISNHLKDLELASKAGYKIMGQSALKHAGQATQGLKDWNAVSIPEIRELFVE